VLDYFAQLSAREKCPPKVATWAALEEFVARAHAFAAERCALFPEVLARCDAVFCDHDGDPSRSNWSHFRPLRVDREEDWSDWLQHFIATSTTGHFSHQLFSRLAAPSGGFGVPEVLREDTVDDRRADLVIRWQDSTRTHVEVKVGDRSFAKTVETASSLEKKYPAKQWSHFILLPSEDVRRWDAVDRPQSSIIQVLTWDDVAVSLRRTLRRKSESRLWRVWAHGFCGLVEQSLLGHPLADSKKTSLNELARRVNQISVMQRGLEDV